MDLLTAVETESLETIQKLVENQGIPRDSQWQDYAALNYSLESGKKDLALYLIEKKCRVNKTGKRAATPMTPLHKAVQLGDGEIVTALLNRRASVLATDFHDGNSPLHLAFLNRNNEIIDLLLSSMEKYSAFRNIKNKQGLTHLHIACTRANVKVIVGLIKTGINVEDTVPENSSLWPGYTAMHFALEYESGEAVEILCERVEKFREHCFDPNDVNSPSYARKVIDQKLRDLLAMFKYLYPKDPYVRNLGDNQLVPNVHCAFYNETSMDDSTVDKELTAIKDFWDCSDALSLKHIACTSGNVDLVTKLGRNVNARVSDKGKKFYDSYYNFTPLHFAVMYEEYDTAKLLIERGADLNASDNVHGTPLHVALRSKKERYAKLLLDSGADVKVKSSVNHTVLHALAAYTYKKPYPPRKTTGGIQLYCFHGLVELIDVLVDKGVDVNAQDHNGNTALHIFCRLSPKRTSLRYEDEDPIVQRLVRLGAEVDLKNHDGKIAIESMCCLEDVRLVYNEVNIRRCRIIFDHLENLKALEKNVKPETDIYCEKFREQVVSQRYTKYRKEDLLKEQQLRLDEVARLKKLMLDDVNSLYDFLQVEAQCASEYLTNAALKSLVESKSLNEDYPIYSYIIRLQYRRICDYCGVTVDRKWATLDYSDDSEANSDDGGENSSDDTMEHISKRIKIE